MFTLSFTIFLLLILGGCDIICRGQLLGDAESARNMTTGTSKKRSRESEAGAGGRHGDRDSRGGDKHDQRTLEKAVQRCLVSGLFMNAGR